MRSTAVASSMHLQNCLIDDPLLMTAASTSVLHVLVNKPRPYCKPRPSHSWKCRSRSWRVGVCAVPPKMSKEEEVEELRRFHRNFSVSILSVAVFLERGGRGKGVVIAIGSRLETS